MSIRSVLALAAAALVLTVAAAANQMPYERLDPPQPTEGSGKIEVIQFFWYGCPHCYPLEPSLKAWLKSKPSDVVFKRVHAPIGAWERHALIYYTLESMGLLEKMHDKVFDAIHKERRNLLNSKIREEWLRANGIDPQQFAEVEKSFSVATKMKRAAQMSADYKVDSVPRIVVDGKLATGPGLTGGVDKMMAAVDQMIVAERRAGNGSQPPVAAFK